MSSDSNELFFDETEQYGADDETLLDLKKLSRKVTKDFANELKVNYQQIHHNRYKLLTDFILYLVVFIDFMNDLIYYSSNKLHLLVFTDGSKAKSLYQWLEILSKKIYENILEKLRRDVNKMDK